MSTMGTSQWASTGWKVRANNPAVVLLEGVGSRPLNCALAMVLVTLLFSFVYIVLVVATGVEACDNAIEAGDGSEWLGAVLSPPESEEGDVGISMTLLRALLQARAFLGSGAEPLASTQVGAVPWCAMCSSADLLQISTALKDGAQRPLAPVETALNQTSTTVVLSVATFFFDVLSATESFCAQSILPQMLGAFRQSQYLADPPPLPATPRGAEFGASPQIGPGLACLLGTIEGPECGPCGDPQSMSISVEAVNETFAIFTDLVSGQIFDSTQAVRLTDRCAFVLVSSFVDECKASSDRVFFNWFLKNEPTPGSQGNQGSGGVVGGSDSILGNENGKLLTKSFVPGKKNGTTLEESILAVRLGFVDNTGVFQTLARSCSSAGVKNISSLVANTGRGGVFEQIVGSQETPQQRKERVTTAGVCWSAYTMFFVHDVACREAVKKQINVAFEGSVDLEDQSQADLVAFFVYFVLLIDSVVTAIGFNIRPPSGSAIRAGFDSVSFGERILAVTAGNSSDPLKVLNTSNDEDDFNSLVPPDLDEFNDVYGECFQRLDAAPGELTKLLKFLSNIEECRGPTIQLEAGWIIQFVLFVFMLLVALLHVFWLVRGPRTPYSVALLALVLGNALLCNGAYVISGLSSANATSLMHLMFFNVSSPEVAQSAAVLEKYEAAAQSIGLAAIYIFHVFTMIELGARTEGEHSAEAEPEAAASKRLVENGSAQDHQSGIRTGSKRSVCRFPLSSHSPKSERLAAHFAVAAVWAFLRGFVAQFLLFCTMGFVPFVGWISAVRICLVDGVTPFPRCNSPDVDEMLGALPFGGMVLVTVCDAVMLYLASRETRLCKASLDELSFTSARRRQLLFYLKVLLSELAGVSTFIAAIMYCSMINVILGYNGHIAIAANSTDGGQGVRATYLGVSMMRTGVQYWSFGFFLIIFIASMGWLILLVPAQSSLGRLLLSTVSKEQLVVSFVPTEAHALGSSAAPHLHQQGSSGQGAFHGNAATTKVANAVLFDQQTFCLETQFINMMLTLSSYHVGPGQDGSGFVPPGWRVLGYISNESTDTHAWVVASDTKVFVSFRGTTSARNARTDLTLTLARLRWAGNGDAANYSPENSPVESAPVEQDLSRGPQHSKMLDPDVCTQRANALLVQYRQSVRSPKVHRGFLVAFRSVQDEVLRAVLKVFQDQPSRPRLIVTTGHSLGGGLAYLAGAFLGTAIPKALVQVSTFGAPRSGNFSFRRYVTIHTASCWRAVKRGDPIPKTPPRNPCSGSHGYIHIGTEVLLDLSGDVVVDPTLLEHTLLHRCKRGTLGADHKALTYMTAYLAFALGLQAQSRGAPGCKDEEKDEPSQNFYPKLWPNIRKRINDYVVLTLRSQGATLADLSLLPTPPENAESSAEDGADTETSGSPSSVVFTGARSGKPIDSAARRVAAMIGDFLRLEALADGEFERGNTGSPGQDAALFEAKGSLKQPPSDVVDETALVLE